MVFERYRLILRHDYVYEKGTDGRPETHQVEEPLVIEYCIDRFSNPGSAYVLNEMMHSFTRELLKRAGKESEDG